MCDTIGKRIGNRALFAKNSDRSPNEPQVLEWFPAADHEEATLKATYLEIEQVRSTKAFLLSRPVWLWGGEMGVNECGVCIGNEAVFTKGAYGKTGLTGMDLVRLALERSESAREAVEVIIRLLERYGQGGNCGFDYDFYYDNGFLIMDANAIYHLETAGKQWVCKQVESAAISNRLSIGTDGDTYSGQRCDFAKTYTEPVYTFFSRSKQRRSLCAAAGCRAESVEDLFAALRQHDHPGDPLCRASVGSPCMHYGGLVGDHTTQSMVVELSEGETRVWVTGTSMPCVSVFKPYGFGNEPTAPVFPAGDPQAKAYWMEAEQFRRRLLGKVLPEEFYAQRNALEATLLSMSRETPADQWGELSLLAANMEREFVSGWMDRDLPAGKTSPIFRANWARKNAALKG